MKPRIALPVLILITCCLSACLLSSRTSDKKEELYILAFSSNKIPPSSSRSKARILLSETLAPELLAGTRIIFGKEELTRGQYQYARWSEPLSKRVTRIIHEALEKTKYFASVGRDNDTVGGRYLLNTELEEFFHKTLNPPGEVIIHMRAELVDVKNRTVLGTRHFESSQNLDTFNAREAVKAFSKANQKMIEDVSTWTIETVQNEKTSSK